MRAKFVKQFLVLFGIGLLNLFAALRLTATTTPGDKPPFIKPPLFTLPVRFTACMYW